MTVVDHACPACAVAPPAGCVTLKEGLSRGVHLRRVLVALVVALVVAGTRWLPQRERARLANVLAQPASANTAPARDAESAVQPEETATREGPDWGYIGRSLAKAAASAGQISQTLRDEHLFFDLDDLDSDARALLTRLREAHSLICEAQGVDGLVVEEGDDLEILRTRVNIRRAEKVDAELAFACDHKPVQQGTEPWTIEYREHGGGFLATRPDNGGNGPARFWGHAPTLQSAINTLATYVHHQSPPTVVCDPPLPPSPLPWAPLNDDSDVSLEGPRLAEIVHSQSPAYADHLTACAAARDELVSRNVAEYLAERAAELNATEPQLVDKNWFPEQAAKPANLDHGGFANTVQWVPARLVVATGHSRWGEFGTHRPRVPHTIVAALANSNDDDLEEFTRKFFVRDTISLICIPAWAGPLYRLGVNGAHRIHTARMLGLPWLAASVEIVPLAPAWDMWNLINRDLEVSQEPLEQQFRRRRELVDGLLRRRVLDGELTVPDDADEDNPTLWCRRLPAPWLLREPTVATTINAVYERTYPGALQQLGIPTDVGTDPEEWSSWLTG
ncbi:hypothetical protein [Actinopolyspora halophila]|uniref:hypothetical protein n=1 Tax=Actinopolyspora halophila TaxID=1850 RepID=UPI0012F76783|nr:hypothetical protein [Actinopolyspora halophila]